MKETAADYYRDRLSVPKVFLNPPSAEEEENPVPPNTPSPKTASAETDADLVWFDVRRAGLEGKGWTDTEAFYDRLPARAMGVVREEVWELSRHTAGLCVRFATDAKAIWARWSLLHGDLAMPHMPATGVSGLDLYARDEDNQWRWTGLGQPQTAGQNTAQLVDGLQPRRREYLLYLPLYNGVRSVEIGLDPSAAFDPLGPGNCKPIVFYGTSIVQGGCASRPGMAYPAILGRRLDRPAINLGFSGNGRMEPEVAALLGELDASACVLDPLPNMQAQEVSERMEPAVGIIRKAHPNTPIVLMEDRTYSQARFVAACRQRNADSRSALREAHERMTAAGVAHLHYVGGEDLFGRDGEAAVDGSHATDLGFMRMVDVLEPVLRALL